ncbi:MAG: hypothetical protein ACLUQ6_04775 [Alistipes onderdonkii]
MHVLVVAVVHHHDHVEFPEVLLADLPGTVRQFVTAARRSPRRMRASGNSPVCPAYVPAESTATSAPEPAFADDVSA